jgi:hypothetical protein
MEHKALPLPNNLHAAIRTNNEKIIETVFAGDILLQGKHECNYNTSLHVAVINNVDIKILKWMFENGARKLTKERNRNHSTPLHIAVEKCRDSNSVEVVTFLISHGAGDAIFSYDINKNSPLDIAKNNLNWYKRRKLPRKNMKIVYHMLLNEYIWQRRISFLIFLYSSILYFKNSDDLDFHICACERVFCTFDLYKIITSYL